MKILVLHDIYSSDITHAISSLCRDNLGRHPTTLMDCPAYRRTSPAAHLDEILSLLVLLILCEITRSECLMLVMLCEIVETYVLECWILMFVFEHVGNAVRTCLIYGVVRYVMYIWYLWWLCDICDVYVISFVCLDGIEKTNKKVYNGHFAECYTRQRTSLPSVKAIALGREATPGHR